jgi:hypothetical protein
LETGLQQLQPRLLWGTTIRDWLIRIYRPIEDWLNKPLTRFRLLPIDMILFGWFAGCVTWYTINGGWQSGLAAGLLFIFIMLCAMWIWRRS